MGSPAPRAAAAPQKLLGAEPQPAVALRSTRVAASPYRARTVALRTAASAVGRSVHIGELQVQEEALHQESLMYQSRQRAQVQQAARFAPAWASATRVG